MNLKTGALIGVVALVGVLGACVLMTDAATRLGEDLMVNAALLQRDSGSERVFVQSPRSWPSGCEGDYAVELQESLQRGEGLTGRGDGGSPRSATTGPPPRLQTDSRDRTRGGVSWQFCDLTNSSRIRDSSRTKRPGRF